MPVADDASFFSTTRPDAANQIADSLTQVDLALEQGISHADILSVLCDLFAGRSAIAFGENLEWWIETLQCDLSANEAAGVALTVISKWRFDHQAAATGVKALQDQLLQRAHLLIAKAGK